MVDGHIIYAAMEFFGMDSQDSTPIKNGPPSGVDFIQKHYLYRAISQLVDQFILIPACDNVSILRREIEANENEQNSDYFKCR